METLSLRERKSNGYWTSNAGKEKIKRDVTVLKKNARIIHYIGIDGTIKKILLNDNGRLNIIAILGPIDGFDEAVLVEIGIGRGRPYTKAFNTPYRKKAGQLSEIQYRTIASLIFSEMANLARQRIDNWKSREYANVPINRHFCKGEKLYIREKQTIFGERGVRFSFSRQDEFFLKDIFYAERQNFQVQRELNGLAKFIDVCLSRYRKNPPPVKYLWGTGFLKLKGFEQIRKSIEEKKSWLRRSPYLLSFMMEKYLPGGRKHQFWDQIAKMLGVNDAFRENRLADAVLSGADQRLGNLRVRVSPDETNNKFIVVEVYYPR